MKVSLIKEGKELLETTYANVLANITLKRLTVGELKSLIDLLEKQK